jgi:hypothetical protein
MIRNHKNNSSGKLEPNWLYLGQICEDLLNEAFNKNPELEQIATESNEPIFIKNLENVQGDERDVILFSVGYGPDKDGKLYLNFGPLNRDGGWRRLNVAVSRARYEMKVYSTLRSDQIDISRTSSEGVAGIKAFLEYTEKGKIALQQKHIIKKTSPRYFEKMVAEQIQKLGYTVHTDIGSSGYRIDIGIVNSEKPSEYILGILTDGRTYRAAKTAKDREVVQTDVLKMLGWNIYKLWSPDWWDNPDKVIKDIVQRIEFLQKPNNKEEAPDNESFETKRKEYADVKLRGITQVIIEPTQNFTKYLICNLKQSYLNVSDEFFEPRLQSKIREQVEQVLAVEAPISHTLLSRRILNAWGISRLGVRLNKHLTTIYSRLGLNYTTQNGMRFYWEDELQANNYQTFRIPKEGDQKRNPEDLPVKEIINGIVDILTNQISLPETDLIREVAKLFDYTRLGGNVEQAMKLGIKYGLETGIIISKDGRIVLSEEAHSKKKA